MNCEIDSFINLLPFSSLLQFEKLEIFSNSIYFSLTKVGLALAKVANANS